MAHTSKGSRQICIRGEKNHNKYNTSGACCAQKKDWTDYIICEGYSHCFHLSVDNLPTSSYLLPNSGQYLFIITVLLFLKDSRGEGIAGESGCGVLIDSVHLPWARTVYEPVLLCMILQWGKPGLKILTTGWFGFRPGEDLCLLALSPPHLMP